VKEPARMAGKACVQERKQTVKKSSVKISAENLVVESEKRRTKLLKRKIQPEPHMAKDSSASSPKHVEEQEQQVAPLPSSATRKIPLSSFPKVDSQTEKR
jgi:hypothetical protein